MVPQAGIGMKNNAVFLADFRRFLPLFRLLKCHFIYVLTLFYPLSWLIRGEYICVFIYILIFVRRNHYSYQIRGFIIHALFTKLNIRYRQLKIIRMQ